MPKNSYKTPKNTPLTANEPAAAYQTTSSTGWNPNIPFHGTQEEWWDHFHRIEEGPFYTREEANEKFEKWKKEFLASRSYIAKDL